MKTTFGVFIAIVLILGVGGCIAYQNSTETVTITVTGKERVSYGSGDSTHHKYLIFTDHETFEVTDTIAFGRFNSSDVYGRLRQGETYTVTVAGWRYAIFSSYRNIIKIH